MAAPALPREVQKLRESLVKDQAPSARKRTEYFDPSVFVNRHGRPYSSLKLPISTMNEMRSDALLRFAQLLSLVPIFTGKFRIECGSARKAAFVDQSLRRIQGRLFLQFYECVPAGERVMMADGSLRAIEDVAEGDFVLSSDGTEIVPDRVESAWRTETKQILRIKLSDGRVMRVSPDHKVFRWDDWVRAGDLLVGDPVTVPRKVPYLGVDDWDLEAQKDDAFLLALWLAEGNKGYNQGFSVCNVDPLVVARAREVAERKGWDFHHDPTRGVMRMTGNSFYRRGPTPPNFLRAYGVIDMTTSTIGIPDQIMSAPTDVVAEFIGTYVACDGTVKRAGASGSGCQSIFYSASERLVRDMQTLLTRLGVRGNVSSESRQHGHLDCWKTTISAAEENQKLADSIYVYGKDEKLKRLASEAVSNLRSERDCTIPPAIYEDLPHEVRTGTATKITGRSWTDSRRALAAAQLAGDEALEGKLTSGLGWARIVSISEDGSEPCYDLQTREHHSFFLESGLVHNSWNFGWQSIVKEFGLMNPSWMFIDKEASGGPAAQPVWDGGPDVPALVWEPFVPLRPSSVAPVWTAGGAFNGIAVSSVGGKGSYSVPTVPLAPSDVLDIPFDMSSYFNDKDNPPQKVDVDHSLWVTNERDGQFGSIWGRSRLSYAYKYWWSYEMALGILNRSVERKGDPTIVVTYPQGSSRVGNQDVPNQTIAFDIGNKARSGSVLVVPSEVWGEETGTANQSPKWNIQYLKAEEQFDKLIAVLGYLDTMKIRSMMISELSFAEGSGGSSSRNVAATTGERGKEAQIFTQVEWDEIINRYMIPQLADQNFPELKDEPARKVTVAYGENESALAADILRSLANADPTALPLDLPAMLDRFSIDALTGEGLAKWERDLVTKVENSVPPATPAVPNGAAGTTDTGFYYDARERIELTDDALLASLPKTKHYADRTVLAQTRLVRKLWHGLLTEQYEDFAVHVSSLELAEAKRAKEIVDAWRYASAKYAATTKRLFKAMLSIFARAGALELSSSKLDPKVFDPSDKTMTAWVNDNVAVMVRGVEETTRKQLSSYLALSLEKGSGSKEIAAGIREHFATFANWRADLIAREETKRFYNAATLFAAEAADSKQVQALDAQDGPTDADCMARNGRLFSIQEAWVQSRREHVRGTLGWRILPAATELSVSYTSEEDADGIAARIDLEERVIHLAEGLATDVEGEYLERVVGWFIAAR